jgi:hypothetical protein
MLSADGLRKAWGHRVQLLPIEPVMRITGEGLVLGAGTVLAKHATDGLGRPSLAIDGNEDRLVALLSVAHGKVVDPGVIDHIRRASRAYGRDETCLALIHLAYTGLSRLAEEERGAYRLFLAKELLDAGVPPRDLLRECGLEPGPDARKAGFNPDEPRVPAGNPDGGQWTNEGNAPEIVPGAARRPESRRGDPDAFFDTVYDNFHALAERLAIDETWLLGLAAHESGYLNPHNRDLNDPFGVTHGGGPNVAYGSMDAAIAYWERRFGPVVQGATSAGDFVRRLYADHYNRRDPLWAAHVMDVIHSIPNRLASWKAKRGI